MDYQIICDKVRQVAIGAGEFIREQRLTFSTDKVELKGRHNLVSYVDKEAEKLIVAGLLQIIPNSSVLAEEGTNSGTEQAEYCWIIDPLDGTTNFVHGMPPYCVSIALQCGTESVVGVVYEITADECFYAWQGSAAYMNGKQISVSGESEIENSLVITGLAYNIDHVRERFNKLFDYFNRNSHGARRLGSAAADLAYVAIGRAECFYQANLSPWDVAAGALIVQRAGGCVTDFREGDDYVFGKEIIATNAVTHKQFLDIIK